MRSNKSNAQDNFNKILEINDVINYALRQLICIVLS